MKRSILLPCFAILLCTIANAQTFTNNTVTAIPDDNAAIVIPINVSGLPNIIDPSFGLTNVCINLSHDFIGQLTIVLKAPTGTDSVRLLWHNGGNAAIHSSICFTEAGTQPIAAYPVAAVSDYFGETDNNIMNDGRNPNGVWSLKITDVVPSIAGSINSTSISFGNNPPPTHQRIFGCSVAAPWNCRCPDGSNDCDLLPDITNSQLALADNFVAANAVHFSVATPNIGYGPLEMIGSLTECFCGVTPVPCGTICPAGQELKHNVYQTIYHRSGNTMTTSTRLAGQMEYHPTHNHIHLEHWTNNTLRIRSTDPNPTHWPIIGSANKISSCLINLGSCSYYPGYCKDNSGNTLTNNDIPNFQFGTITGCDLAQGIFVGNLDIYDSSIDGQEINLDGICNGSYYLVSITDPDNFVAESDDNNNYAAALVSVIQNQNYCCKTGFYADTLHGKDSLTVHFTDTTVSIPNTWYWDFGDDSGSTEQFPTHTYLHPGVYTVRLTTINELGCTNSLIRKNYIEVSTDVNTISVTISPNPFSDHISLSFSTPEVRTTSVTVYDAIGRKIYSKQVHLSAGISSFDLTGKMGASAGLYFVKINGGDYSKVFKVIRR